MLQKTLRSCTLSVTKLRTREITCKTEGNEGVKKSRPKNM